MMNMTTETNTSNKPKDNWIDTLFYRRKSLREKYLEQIKEKIKKMTRKAFTKELNLSGHTAMITIKQEDFYYQDFPKWERYRNTRYQKGFTMPRIMAEYVRYNSKKYEDATLRELHFIICHVFGGDTEYLQNQYLDREQLDLEQEEVKRGLCTPPVIVF